MALPAEGVTWDPDRSQHVVVLAIPADEVRTIATLAYSHRSRDRLLAWADEADALDEDTVWVPVGVPDEAP